METASKKHQPPFCVGVTENALKNAKTTKNLEPSDIALCKRYLNEQMDFQRLFLSRNGVT